MILWIFDLGVQFVTLGRSRVLLPQQFVVAIMFFWYCCVLPFEFSRHAFCLGFYVSIFVVEHKHSKYKKVHFEVNQGGFFLYLDQLNRSWKADFQHLKVKSTREAYQ